MQVIVAGQAPMDWKALFHGYEGLGSLTPLFVRHTNHGNFADCRMPVEYLFDFNR